MAAAHNQPPGADFKSNVDAALGVLGMKPQHDLVAAAAASTAAPAVLAFAAPAAPAPAPLASAAPAVAHAPTPAPTQVPAPAPALAAPAPAAPAPAPAPAPTPAAPAHSPTPAPAPAATQGIEANTLAPAAQISAFPPVPPTTQYGLALMNAYPGFQVEHEDCLRPGDTSLFLPAHPLSAAPELSRVHGDVYVQNARDYNRFRPVPADRVRKAYKIGAAQGQGSSRPRPVPGDRQTRGSTSMGLSGVISSLDPDATFLHLSEPADIGIYELLLDSKRCEAYAKFFSFVCQCALSGFCAAAGLLALGAEGELLARLQATVEPGLSRLTIVFAEISLVGSFLDIWGSYELIRASGAAVASSLDSTVNSEMGGGRHFVVSHAIKVLILACVNFGIMLTCLISARGEVAIMYEMVDADENGAMSLPATWDAAVAHDLLLARALLGFAAILFVVPRGLEMLSNTHLISLFATASQPNLASLSSTMTFRANGASTLTESGMEGSLRP